MGLVKETEAFTTGQNHWLGADYSFVQFYFLQYYFVYTQNILVKETLKRETLKKLWTLAVRAVLFTSFRQRGRRSFSELKAQYKKTMRSSSHRPLKASQEKSLKPRENLTGN